MTFEGQVAYLTYEKHTQNSDLKTQLERQVKRPSNRRKENIKMNLALGVPVWLDESVSSRI